IRDALVAAHDVVPERLLDPAPAPREDLLLVHTAEYLDDLAELRWTPRTLYSELPLTPEIVRAYQRAAGGTALAPRGALRRGLGAEYLRLLDGALQRVCEFAPEIVLYQAGADPYREDLLGGLMLTFEGLEARDRRVLEGCATRRIPAVVTLGGGYARDRNDTVRIHATTCRVAMRLCDAGAPERAT